MIQSLQSLRGIFALLIFIHHWRDAINFSFGASFGDAGVVFFFILSGYVMCQGFSDKALRADFSFKHFFLRRLWRLYPLYLLTMTYVAVLYHGLWPGRVLLCDLFCVQTFIPYKFYYFSCNAVAWCIPAFLAAYLIFPAANRLMRTKPLIFKRLLICTIAVYVPIVLFGLTDYWAQRLLYVNPLLRLIDFVIGMYVWNMSTQSTEIRDIAARCLPLSILLVAAAMMLFGYLPERIQVAMMWWIPIGTLVMSAAAADNTSSFAVRILRLRLPVKFGNISFSFYMLHFPIIITITAFVYKITGETELSFYLTAPALIICVATAYLCHRFFEKSVTKFLDSRLP